MPTTDPTLALCQALIARPSVTPDDAGCQVLIGQRLAALGFELTPLRFGAVDNLWAQWGEQGPCFVFAGHTDVVPSGAEADWTSPPFRPVIRDGYLYGRGAADMKGSLAAMVTACERLFAERPPRRGRIAFLLTSDEEGPAVDGTARVVDHLIAEGTAIDWCLVGEPSSSTELGDVIRVGRRGSLNGELTVFGRQGHVAYPQLARNPIHAALPALDELARRRWDDGDGRFPPTSFQIANLQAGTGASNVIPGEARVQFNFRYNRHHSAASLRAAVEAVLARYGLEFRIDWSLSGEPFYTGSGALVDATLGAIRDELDVATEASTGGGTSDGRFIAKTGAEVVELGPVNATIHQVDERVAVADLDRLSRCYERILRTLVA
jgi:succinyl-diaminopimelate desuccinylase